MRRWQVRVDVVRSIRDVKLWPSKLGDSAFYWVLTLRITRETFIRNMLFAPKVNQLACGKRPKVSLSQATN